MKTFETPPEGASDWEVAQGIRDEKYASPTRYGDFWLYDVRITVTNVAYREEWGEWTARDADLWTSDEFVSRCAGLPVILGHPLRTGLNSEEFRQRAIGTIILPYKKDAEVRGIAKIFDADAAEMMQTTHRSTSPGVTPPEGSKAVELKSGDKILLEGLPRVLDHLAVCELGVWDKNGHPSGIQLD